MRRVSSAPDPVLRGPGLGGEAPAARGRGGDRRIDGSTDRPTEHTKSESSSQVKIMRSNVRSQGTHLPSLPALARLPWHFRFTLLKVQGPHLAPAGPLCEHGITSVLFCWAHAASEPRSAMSTWRPCALTALRASFSTSTTHTPFQQDLIRPVLAHSKYTESAKLLSTLGTNTWASLQHGVWVQ